VFLLAVVVIALSLLFLLTALALGAAHRLHHPYRVGLALASALLIGPRSWSSSSRPAAEGQGRQDSNLRPTVLETAALPAELRPCARRIVPSLRMSQRRALGLLFLVLTLGFGGIGYASADAGRWVIAAAALALGGWMLSMSVRLLRRS
jgi:hypothetical protein